MALANDKSLRFTILVRSVCACGALSGNLAETALLACFDGLGSVAFESKDTRNMNLKLKF